MNGGDVSPGSWPDPRDPNGKHVGSPAELVRMNAAERTGVPLLTWRGQAGSLEILELYAGQTYYLGRRPETAVPIVWDSHASALHCELAAVSSEWILTDAGLSKNGTYVGGRRVDIRTRLHDGDKIRIGKSLVAFHGGAEPGIETTLTTDDSDTQTVKFDDTDREILKELCRLWVRDGLPATVGNKEIADKVGFGSDNIDKRLGKMYARCGLGALRDGEKRVALAAYVTRHGVISRRDYRGD